MKKLLPVAVAAIALAAACTTDSKSTWQQYEQWRNANNSWLTQMQSKKDESGQPYYKTIVPSWAPGSFVLVHYFNDRKLTEGNLSPLFNSTVDTRYWLHDYEGTPVDSSTLVTSTGTKGVYRAQLSSLIPGWAAALSDMRCGDTAEIIVPYALAYGDQGSNALRPYSNLRFNVRLVDIPYYETNN